MHKRIALFLLLATTASHADLSGGGLMDYYGNGVTSNLFGGTRNALDVETVFSGSVVDPRARTWTLLNTTDSVNAVQSGSWTVLQGSPPWAVSQSGTWTTGRTWSLSSGTDSISSIQGTSPWVTNITQFGGIALSTGTGSSGAGIPRVTVSNDSNVLSTQSGTWTVQQGSTPTTLTNAWPVKPTDGTNAVTIKAASTAALATDTSLVVGLSPNSPVPTGSNNIGSLTNITGTISLPTGAATANNQTNVQSAAGSSAGTLLSVQGSVSGVPIPGNITQFGGNAISTGTGASGTGIPRVTVSNDSQVKVWDGSNIATIKASTTPPVVTDTALVTSERPDNLGVPTFTTVSCATTSTTLLAAGTATMYLSIRNPVTATATVWIRFDGTAAAASSPSVDLPPGAEWDGFAFGTSFLSTAQFNCISGGASASSLSLNYK